MKFPPPAALVFLAYCQGNISEKEYLEFLELFKKKHEEELHGAICIENGDMDI